jgi:hypothetical protein
MVTLVTQGEGYDDFIGDEDGDLEGVAVGSAP